MATGKRNWKFLVYPDSAPENWLELLEDVGVPTLVSPLHDADVDEDGRLKKPHWHVMICLEGAKPYDEVLEWFRPLGVSILKDVRSIKRDERYMCHLDSPSKAKYEIEGLTVMNGYECKWLGERENEPFVAQIHRLVEEQGITYYCDLCNEIAQRYPELQQTLIKYNAYFNNFMNSRERMVNQLKKLGITEMRDKDGNVITGLMSSYRDLRFSLRDV